VTDNAYHNARLDEANRFRALRALQHQEAEVRRLAEERWQRRLWATMPVASIESSGDFWGSKL
jgi:hypothetical protein